LKILKFKLLQDDRIRVSEKKRWNLEKIQDFSRNLWPFSLIFYTFMRGAEGLEGKRTGIGEELVIETGRKPEAHCYVRGKPNEAEKTILALDCHPWCYSCCAVVQYLQAKTD
jgi:hypothetical protein